MKREHRAASRDAAKGRLIAVDGTRGADVRKYATALCRRVHSRKAPAGVSHWDASGVFFEMGLGKRKHRVASARTLLLLYASDLMFRLRWEIGPALAAGQTVVAAPYVDTAVAFGRANGLSSAWLSALFAFAPAADDRHLAPEHKKSAGWKKERQEGFAEFAREVLAVAVPSFEPIDARRKMIACLEAAHPDGRRRSTPSKR